LVIGGKQMINTKYVVIIEDNEEVWSMSKRLFENENRFQIKKVDSSMKSVKDAMLTIPDLVIINEDSLKCLCFCQFFHYCFI
jgi:hypothetical protein